MELWFLLLFTLAVPLENSRTGAQTSTSLSPGPASPTAATLDPDTPPSSTPPPSAAPVTTPPPSTPPPATPPPSTAPVTTPPPATPPPATAPPSTPPPATPPPSAAPVTTPPPATPSPATPPPSTPPPATPPPSAAPVTTPPPATPSPATPPPSTPPPATPPPSAAPVTTPPPSTPPPATPPPSAAPGTISPPSTPPPATPPPSAAPVTTPPPATPPPSTPPPATPPPSAAPVTTPPPATPPPSTPPPATPPPSAAPVTTPPPATAPETTPPPSTPPPATSPPSTLPPATAPETTPPPATSPPSTPPPSAAPETTPPPSTPPPATSPPSTLPPSTAPVTTPPPATLPPSAAPETTPPPSTPPPATSPPSTLPPATAPETTPSPATAPETTSPPSTLPPSTAPVTTPPPSTPPPSAAPETTPPSTPPPATSPPSTLPPSTAPVTTPPPATLPPSAAPETTPPPSTPPETTLPPSAAPVTTPPPATPPPSTPPPSAAPVTTPPPATPPPSTPPPATPPPSAAPVTTPPPATAPETTPPPSTPPPATSPPSTLPPATAPETTPPPATSPPSTPPPSAAPETTPPPSTPPPATSPPSTLPPSTAPVTTPPPATLPPSAAPETTPPPSTPPPATSPPSTLPPATAPETTPSPATAPETTPPPLTPPPATSPPSTPPPSAAPVTTPLPNTTTTPSTPRTTTLLPRTSALPTVTSNTTPPPVVCMNGGMLVSGVCVCPDEWTGQTCSVENFCGAQKLDGFSFPLTPIGWFAYSKEVCPQGTSGASKPQASIRCSIQNGSPSFQRPPRVLQCDQTLSDIQQNLTSTADLETLAASTQILTSNPEELTSENITTAARIVNTLLLSPNTTQEIRVSAVATVSQLMSANSSDDSQENNVTLGLTVTLDQLSVDPSLTLNTTQYQVVQPNLVVQSAQIPAADTQGVQFTSVAGTSSSFVASRIQLNTNTSSVVVENGFIADALIFIQFPPEAVRGRLQPSNATLGFVLYQNNAFFRSRSYKSQWANIRVLSASVKGQELSVVPQHVEMLFRPAVLNGTSLYDFACVFWDYAVGDWSTAGCSKGNASDGLLRCFCNHTTNFAALWSFRETYEYAEVLDWISVIGLSLSILGLIVTIGYHITSLHKESWKNFKHINIAELCICFSLLAFTITFVTGVENFSRLNDVALEVSTPNTIPQTEEHTDPDRGSCSAVVALLHLFLLATFTWISIYGIQAVLLTRGSHTLPSHWWILSQIVGWGVPAVVTAITMGVAYRVDDPLGYRQEEFCWLAALDKSKEFNFGKPMFWGFLLPLGLILICDVVLFVIRCREFNNLKSWKNIINVFSLMVMFGLSWLLGYLVLVTTGPAHLALSIVFCLCTATQGLQIFIFFTARKDDFRSAVSRSSQYVSSVHIHINRKYRLWKNSWSANSSDEKQSDITLTHF